MLYSILEVEHSCVKQVQEVMVVLQDLGHVYF